MFALFVVIINNVYAQLYVGVDLSKILGGQTKILGVRRW